MYGFLISLGMVFLAELGDKTQLVALCYASRYNAKVVLAGISLATLVVHLVSVGLGIGLSKLIPTSWIQLASGLAFIGFGFWTLRGDSLDEEECKFSNDKSPFWLIATTFFLAELGDKTMLSTVTLATKYPAVYVWLGSTVGMVISDGIAIIVGQMLGKSLPQKLVKIGAAVIFFAFGIFGVFQGARELPIYSWIIAVGIIVLFTGLFIRSNISGKAQAAVVLDSRDSGS